VLSDGKGEGMTRYHFFEGLVRFALAKYVDTGAVITSAEAIQMLIDIDIAQKKTDSWMRWRQQVLWTKQVNESLQNNQAGIQKLFTKYGDLPNKQELSRKDCVELTCKSTTVLHNPNDAINAFAMSKQIVVAETSKKGKETLNNLTLVEFYEFIVRVA
jgi:hypothetical protein